MTVVFGHSRSGCVRVLFEQRWPSSSAAISVCALWWDNDVSVPWFSRPGDGSHPIPLLLQIGLQNTTSLCNPLLTPLSTHRSPPPTTATCPGWENHCMGLEQTEFMVVLKVASLLLFSGVLQCCFTKSRECVTWPALMNKCEVLLKTVAKPLLYLCLNDVYSLYTTLSVTVSAVHVTFFLSSFLLCDILQCLEKLLFQQCGLHLFLSSAAHHLAENCSGSRVPMEQLNNVI